jgi:hypothetical protein
MKICKYIRTYSLLCLWVIAVGVIVRSYQPASSPQSPHYYASDTTTSVLGTLGVMLAELIGLYLLLEPWHRPRSVIGSLVALALLTPWTFLSTVAAMHASNSVFLHAVWLWVVEGFLVVYTLFAFGSLQSRSSD